MTTAAGRRRSPTGGRTAAARGPYHTDQGRGMPEEPPRGYAPYRFWGALPAGVGWKARLLDWLLGRPHRLLYLGVTCREAMTRWAEHLAKQPWAGEIDVMERDPDIWWRTWSGTVGRGRVREEGAQQGELKLIAAERPVYNIDGNDPITNPYALADRTRVKRILPRHVAEWRRQAAVRASGWTVLAVVLWLLGGSTLAAVPGAISWSAAVIVTGQIAGPALRGIAARRGRPRSRR